MQICPHCEMRFPRGHTHCDHDGSLLIPDTTHNEKMTEISISESGFEEVAPGATSAESPSGRQRLGSSDGRRDPQMRTRYDGTRVSVGTPPPMPVPAKSGDGKPKSEGARRRDEAKAQAESRVGEVLGSYRIQSVLGLGGMGAVYAAEHIKLGRRVALKLLHRQYAARHEAVVRFFQEAQAVNRIRHKNIVDVTDLVELDDGTVFIIMELLDGESLGGRLRTQGLLGTGPTISVLIQICDALQAAHSVDIVHRDLKPDNIFLTTTDEGDLLVKLLDFGVAKLIGKSSEVGVQTAAGSVVGTPAFMSPEQAGALQIDRRSDIYSLGAIMYQLFTGQHVFRGKSFGDYVKMHLNQDPVAPRQTPGGHAMDPQLEQIIMRCLKKSPTARFQSAAELRLALVEYFEEFADRVGGVVEGESGVYRLSGVYENAFGAPPTHAAPPSTIHSSPGHAVFEPVPETAMMVGNLPGSPPSKRGPLYIVAGAVVAVLAVVGISLAVSGGDTKKATAPVDNSAAVVIDAAPEPIPLATRLPIDAAPETPEVAIRIESNVLARVFDEGAKRARCGTPCEFTMPLEKGAEHVHRFVIRASGYEDGELEIDLDNPQDVYAVELAETPAIADSSKGAKTSKNGKSGKTSKNSKNGTSKDGKNGTSKDGKNGGSKNGAGNGSGAVPADKTLDPFKKNKRSR